MGKKVYVDLTHPFSAEIPRWPYFDKPEITNAHTMAKGGVLTSKITCTMHTGTHCDAPRHVMEYEFDGRRARYTHEMPIDAYTGEAVVLKLDVEPWTLITDKHLDEACKKWGVDPASLKGKVLCLNTGMHRLFDDSKAYYHYAIGTGIDAGKWFVKHGVKCVAMDGQALDHPLHTAMGNNGMTRMNLLGATGKPITEEYKELFGEEAYAEFDKFEYIRIHGQAAYDEKFGELENLGFTVLPSQANFVFARHDRLAGETVYRKLKEDGVLVRWFDGDRIRDYVRITIGSMEQMETLVEELTALLEWL